MAVWWGTEKDPSDMLKEEMIAVKKYFNPKRDYYVPKNTRWDQPFWIHTLGVKLDRIEGNKKPFWLISFVMIEENKMRSRQYEIKIQYFGRPNAAVPRAYLVSEDPDTIYHLYEDGSLCLFHGDKYEGWDPSKSTAATIALWAVEWIRAREHYKRTGNWPETA